MIIALHFMFMVITLFFSLLMLVRKDMEKAAAWATGLVFSLIGLSFVVNFSNDFSIARIYETLPGIFKAVGL